MTRHSPYHGDKLSRLALPSELIERRSPCGIRSLTDGRARGPHFAEAIGVLLNFPTKGAGVRRRTPGAYLTRCLARIHFSSPSQFGY
jgi:hypothetical protein